MNRESFDELADVVSEALMLIASDGRIEAVNRPAGLLLGNQLADQVVDRSIKEFLSQSERLEGFLDSCLRTSSEVIGSLHFANQDKSHIVLGRRLSGGHATQILLRVKSPAAAIEQFSVLNDKINQLNTEIKRRLDVETQLRLERDIAEFGRDIGIVLVRSGPLPTVLTRCCDLMVERLQAAFARIWLVDAESHELQLLASSGLYTHTDGGHARIPVGEFKIGRIAQKQMPYVSNRLVGDPEIHDQAWVQREGMQSFAGFPLIVDSVTLGVMAMFSRSPLGDTVAAAMGSVANGIALHIRKHTIEDGLARKTQALQEADRRKDEFLAMLSHELRNPLTPVRTGLDLLALEQSEYGDIVLLMQQQVEHLVRLVDDLLDMSRIMLGKIELRREPFDLKQLLAQAVAVFDDALLAAEQSCKLVVPEAHVWINADAMRIKQAIENLLKNACKYTDHGGDIELRLRVDAGQAIVEVTDSGIGIEPELLPQVFDLFTQSTRSLDRSQGGLGIGLTLVKNLVELHGGEVTATSPGLGQGSTFRISLPTSPAVMQPTAARGVSIASSRPLKILAVDDNRGARFVLARLFEKLGPYEVVTAEDGPSALAQLTCFTPQLIVLDIGLPGMNGYEIAKIIRRRPEGHTILLVALTGYGQKDDRRKSHEAGFDLHLVKPPGIQQLRELLIHPKLVPFT